VTELYGIDFYNGLIESRQHNEAALWGAFAVLGRPGSFIDFGCGDGWLVYTAKTAGVPLSVGVEVSEDVVKVAPPGTEIVVHDLTKPFNLDRQFDLVISWEVGEHLPMEYANIFVKSVASHVGAYLVFTAAHLGQDGYHHINCQDQEYWRLKFISQGLKYDEQLTMQMRNLWAWCVGPLRYLVDNVQVFVR